MASSEQSSTADNSSKRHSPANSSLEQRIRALNSSLQEYKSLVDDMRETQEDMEQFRLKPMEKKLKKLEIAVNELDTGLEARFTSIDARIKGVQSWSGKKGSDKETYQQLQIMESTLSGLMKGGVVEIEGKMYKLAPMDGTPPAQPPVTDLYKLPKNTCEKCSLAFHTEPELKAHIERAHPDGKTT